MKIYKYRIPLESEFQLSLPQKARILTVQAQQEQPHMWVLCNPKNATECRKFRFVGTGHEIKGDEHLQYIGTFQLNAGSFIGHIFEDIAMKSKSVPENEIEFVGDTNGCLPRVTMNLPPPKMKPPRRDNE